MGANIGSCGRGNASKEFLIFRDPNNTTGGRISLLANNESACPAFYGQLATLSWNISLAPQVTDTINKVSDTLPAGGCAGAERIKQYLALGSKDPQSIADGALHRVTIFILKESGDQVGDGIVRMWVDGTIVINYNGSDPTDPAYHQTYTRTNVGTAAPIAFPTVLNAGSQQLQSQWFDNVLVWHHP